MKFIIVYHRWFTHSEGFMVDEVECANEDEAYSIACVEKNITESRFKDCAFKIIPIAQNEEIANRRLTLWERLSGRLTV